MGVSVCPAGDNKKSSGSIPLHFQTLCTLPYLRVSAPCHAKANCQLADMLTLK